MHKSDHMLISVVAKLSRTGHQFRAHGGAKLRDSDEIAFRRTTHDSLCILCQELPSKRTVQSLKRVWIQGGDNSLDRSAVERYEVRIAVHERDPIAVHAHIGLIAGKQHCVSIA